MEANYNIPKLADRSFKYYWKIFVRSMLVLASYSTKTRNGTYALKGHFKKLFDILEEKDYHPK